MPGSEKMRYKQLPERDWAFAACDNPDCPRHPKNGGRPNQHYPMYTNGMRTYCDVCMQTASVKK
jgi:hypothetical protein